MLGPLRVRDTSLSQYRVYGSSLMLVGRREACLPTVSLHTEAELLPVATCVEAYFKCLQHAGICISYVCMSPLFLCAHSVVLRNLLGDD